MIARRRLLQAAAALVAAPAAHAAGPAIPPPLRGVSDATGDLDATATLEGRWPEALRGRFYRNGPALFERGGRRYHHWFDGDGMVQQFRIGDGQVRHRGRLVRTAKLQLEREAGRFLRSGVGTVIEGGPPASGPDSFNTANTSAIEHAGRVLALWEGGSAHALDVDDLSTRGPVTWGAGLQQVPFSAHPKRDPQGHLWNIGAAGRRLVSWHIAPDGRLVRAQVSDSPFPFGMVHDMAVTERHLVVPLPPVKLDFAAPAPGGRRRFAMSAGEPLRVLVMAKDDATRRRVFELPPQMVFHVGNAHETADGEIVLSYIGAPDVSFLDQGAVDLLAGRTGEPGGRSEAFVARLSMASGSARVERLPGGEAELEFPRVHPDRIGLPARWLVSGAAWPGAAPSTLSLLHGVQLLDMQEGRVRRWDYGPGVIAEEHVWVPRPGGRGELDAWLLGTTWEARLNATVLNLLEAHRLEAGPVARAVLPYTLPLGFHGHFEPA